MCIDWMYLWRRAKQASPMSAITSLSGTVERLTHQQAMKHLGESHLSTYFPTFWAGGQQYSTDLMQGDFKRWWTLLGFFEGFKYVLFYEYPCLWKTFLWNACHLQLALKVATRVPRPNQRFDHKLHMLVLNFDPFNSVPSDTITSFQLDRRASTKEEEAKRAGLLHQNVSTISRLKADWSAYR